MKLLPLTWRLQRLSKAAAPRPEFEQALRLKLEERGALLHIDRTRAGWSGLSFRVAGVMACFVLIFGSVTAAYAYTSDEVLPEHPLYPLRQSVEDLEETLAVTPKLRERVERRHIARKVREIEILNKRAPQIETRPAGEALERIQNVMQKGLETNAPASQIKQDVLKEVREAKIKIGNARFRRQLNIIEKRLQGRNQNR